MYQESFSCSIALNAGRGKAGRGEGEGGSDEQSLMQTFFEESFGVILFLELKCWPVLLAQLMFRKQKDLGVAKKRTQSINQLINIL